MTDPIIKVSNLHKSFGHSSSRFEVLKGLDLAVNPGEMIAIRGRSGTGKTTILNILGGLDGGFSGNVRVAGRDLERLDDRALSLLRNEAIGFVFQSFNLIDSMTCEENIMLPAQFASRRGVTVGRPRLEEVLRRVGLSDRAGALPHAMSGGQRQRCAIGRAILLGPRILLCDEPTGNLDSETGRQVLDLFQDLNGTEGITIVIVTHEPDIARIAGRILELRGGVLA